MSGNRPNGQPRWVPPPGWPEPPFQWSPPTGWTPDASWGPVPPGWSVWQDADGRPAAPPWSPGSPTPPRRVHPPSLKAGDLRNTSPRHKKSTAGVIAFILLAFLAGGCANDKPTEPDTTSAAAEGRKLATDAVAYSRPGSRTCANIVTGAASGAGTVDDRSDHRPGAAQHGLGAARHAGGQGTCAQDRLRPRPVRPGVGRHRPQRLRHPLPS